MEAKIHIVNDDGSIVSRTYELNGRKYEFIAVTSTGWRAMDAIDTVKNTKTGKIKDIERLKLYLKTRG